MRLRLSADCITVDLSENSSHFLHVSDTLSKKFSKSFWVNETLINLPTQKEIKKRKEFLTSLYYTCAFASQTQNLAFLQKLIALHDKPIKVIQKEAKFPLLPKCHTTNEHYKILEANEGESLQSIRKKYLRLAKTYHPDHNRQKSETNTPSYTEKFQKIQEAYATIKSQKSKKKAA